MHFKIYFQKLHTEWVTSHLAVSKNNFKTLDKLLRDFISSRLIAVVKRVVAVIWLVFRSGSNLGPMSGSPYIITVVLSP